MTTPAARVRVSLSAGEFEIEGPESLIAHYDDLIKDILKRVADASPEAFVAAATPAVPVQISSGAPASSASTTAAPAATLPEFGEALHRMSKNASGAELMLVAGYYASRQSSDRTFPTASASRLLQDHGVKLSNPSQALRGNIDAKRLFKVGSGRSFKISREGLEHVGTLLRLGGPAS